MVYADWLSERGDPRGELIMLQDTMRREAELLAKHSGELLGPIERLPRTAWRIEWNRGFVSSLRLELEGEPEVASVLPEVLAHPSFGLLRSLSAVASRAPLSAAAQAIARDAAPTLTALTLGAEHQAPVVSGPMIGWLDLSRLVSLESLRLHGDVEVVPLELERLESLVLFGDAANSHNLRALSDWRCSQIKTLSLFLGHPSVDPTSACAVVLSAVHRSFPALRHLSLAGALDAVATAQALVESPITRTLETLDLSGCVLSEEEVRSLAVLGCEVVAQARSQARSRDPRNINLNCSFCGKSQREVRSLIAGPTVYICDECIGLCGAILAEQDD